MKIRLVQPTYTCAHRTKGRYHGLCYPNYGLVCKKEKQLDDHRHTNRSQKRENRELFTLSNGAVLYIRIGTRFTQIYLPTYLCTYIHRYVHYSSFFSLSPSLSLSLSLSLCLSLTYIHTYIQTHRDRQTDLLTDRHTNIHTHTHTQYAQFSQDHLFWSKLKIKPHPVLKLNKNRNLLVCGRKRSYLLCT